MAKSTFADNYYWNRGWPRPKTDPIETKPPTITVDRARFERLLAVASSAYIETYEAIVASSRTLQPGDLDPIS